MTFCGSNGLSITQIRRATYKRSDEETIPGTIFIAAPMAYSRHNDLEDQATQYDRHKAIMKKTRRREAERGMWRQREIAARYGYGGKGATRHQSRGGDAAHVTNIFLRTACARSESLGT